MTPIKLPTIYRGGFTIKGEAHRPLKNILADIVRKTEQAQPAQVAREKGQAAH